MLDLDWALETAKRAGLITRTESEQQAFERQDKRNAVLAEKEASRKEKQRAMKEDQVRAAENQKRIADEREEARRNATAFSKQAVQTEVLISTFSDDENNVESDVSSSPGASGDEMPVINQLSSERIPPK